MSIVSSSDILDFLDVDEDYFEITTNNDVLEMSYDSGAYTNVECSDGTYSGSELAEELQGKINSAFSISSTVTYNSSTRKFTIDVGEGHTITIDVSDSDAALTFGFTSDPTAAQSITSDQESHGDPTAIIDTIHTDVEKMVKKYCRRDFESTSYTKDLYDGTGEAELYLDNYPIISVERLAIGTQNGLKVHNSSRARIPCFLPTTLP